jgi:hypothetical protein
MIKRQRACGDGHGGCPDAAWPRHPQSGIDFTKATVYQFTSLKAAPQTRRVW